MCVACVLHDRTDVRKVQVDECRNIDQGRDGLDALTQNVIGSLESVHQGDLLLADHLQALVRDDDETVNMHQQVCDALFGQTHLALALKSKGLGDDADRQDAEVMCDLCDNGSCAGAGAAAHTCGDKDHLRALERVCDLILALLSGTLADLRVCACAAALGQFGAQLHFGRCVVFGQSLLVGVHCDKLHTLQTIADHAVDGVATAAAYADYLDRRNVFVHFFVEHQCHNFCPPSDDIVNLRRLPFAQNSLIVQLYNCIVSSFGSDCKTNLLF